MMKMLFCAMDTNDGTALHLQAVIGSVVGEGNMGVCQGVKELQQELRSPWRGHDVAFLYAKDIPALESYLSLQDLLEDLPVILVLPDGKEGTVRRAHLLRPRFITYTDSDFSDIRAVLEKMNKNLVHKRHR